MANYNHTNDFLGTNTFSPHEFQVELLERARTQNSIICSTSSNFKSFLFVKLAQEFAERDKYKNSRLVVYVLQKENIELVCRLITSLTDLVVSLIDKHSLNNLTKCKEKILSSTVLVTTAPVCSELVENHMIKVCDISLLLFDDGTYEKYVGDIETIMACYSETSTSPRIVALVSGLLGDNFVPDCLNTEIENLERTFRSKWDASCELTNLIRTSHRPNELLISCKQSNSLDLEDTILAITGHLKEFLFDSRYAPDEIYDDELLQEFQNVPNPNAAPLKLVNEFEILLKQYGIWCANQAALQILLITDKLKIKTPYERHFLLLSTLYTQMICVRAHCDNLPVDSLTAIREFSKDKVHRLVEILVDLGPGERPLVERPATPVHVTTTKGSKKMYRGLRRPHPIQSDDSLCVLIFVENVLEAKVLQNLLSTLSQNDPRLRWIIALYIADRTANPQTESKESEVEHRNHEEVLRKFRAHECNILIATKVLEQGYDLPKCNLVIRMQPCSFQSYVHSRARVRSNPSFYLTFVDENKERESLEDYARYLAVEVLLLKHSNFIEASTEEIHQADNICSKYGPYTTNKNESVHLNTAIPLVNRYCAKLPSDTFTKLVPIYNLEWKDDKVRCRLRLPINAPFKITVITAYYDNETLAKRVAAFYMCKALHEYNELDDSLNPISKEHFKPVDDWHDNGDKDEEDVDFDNVDQRPGTTKRRQYYYKRIANALKNCRPLPGQRSYFYKIVMMLTCPIPEEQNTRGRKIYPPEESRQGFGILTSKPLPQICPFPIFTRSGEVQVSLQLINDDYVMEEDMEHKIVEFQNYTFTSVLRLQKYQMVFSPEEAESNYYIVPTVSVYDCSTLIDTTFLCLIYEHRNVLPVTIPDEERNNYKFEATQYEDAVVMPWYRNQDQPQYFYVAEICSNLNPSSSFPGSEYATFDEYYKRKYGIEIQNKEQYLLDVDHTSARLNFLTPRYVNRKGVALPTSSEETKRAKRENLEQKQILVPELCAIHPFPASLWRKAVCLPCILYRMNALLLADEIREMVARDTKLGIIDIPRSFTWEPLNFGWSLCDVLKKNKSSNNLEEIELDRVKTEKKTDIVTIKEICDNEENHNIFEDKPWLEIGTWSNDMVEEAPLKTSVRYGSPTSWLHSAYGYNEYDDFSDSETIYSSEDEEAPESQCGGIQILFQDDYVAEAIETKKSDKKTDLHLSVWGNRQEPTKLHKDKFDKEVAKNVDFLKANSLLTREFTFKKENYVETAVVVNKLGVVFDDECTFICMKTERPLNVSEFRTNLDGGFDFDEDRDLDKHPGPSPSVILQALTMSNANDGINLERLETIGDSFLKYAITDYLYSKYPNTHEGKLSHLRSKQVSNLNLYRLGKKKGLGELMIATKFDPHDNWLPPGYCVSKQLEELLSKAKMPDSALTLADYVATRNMTEEELVLNFQYRASDQVLDLVEPVPYNLVTQHSIPDKSIADCVEALIGAYLIECGPEGALLFMDYLGIRVLPSRDEKRKTPATPHSPFLQSHLIDNQEQKLMRLLEGYSAFEDKLGYSFANKSFLLQALTHASYYPNTVTDCYQRLEFLGDAVLDYLITRHLFEDKRMHSPGALTDLRSALVNNTIFASLAVKFDFHKFFRYLSPGLHQVIEKFIRTQEEVGHKVTEELFLLNFEESDEVEDVEVPKVLGDIFESVAGAIYLDSGQSLNAVWKVYYSMMKSEIEQFSEKVPKSPIRELLELEPETAKFGPAEKLADGRRVRVSVEVFGKGIFKGIGRNYRIAKCTAAKCALKHLKRQCSRFMDF